MTLRREVGDAYDLGPAEPLLLDEAPDMVLVYGDTTTTLAGALAAAKLGLPIGHVEAGLRSLDRSMPEEQNRVVTDHLSSLLLCPTDTAVANLAREGITDGVHQVGDVMLDASRMFAPAVAARPGGRALGLERGAYLLVTVHRAAATDTPEALAALVAVLEAIEDALRGVDRVDAVALHPLAGFGRRDATPATPLTEQERVVLRLMRQHLTYKEIAQRLGISWHTVRTHAQSILRKSGVHSRRDLVGWDTRAATAADPAPMRRVVA